jgi:hypothetical protein
MTNNSPLQDQIEQLEKQLQQQKNNTIAQNKSLQTHLQYLARDLDVLFESKTWKIGYAITNLYRKIMNILGKRHDGQYMNGDHFKNMIENCEFYTHRKTKIHPTLNDTLKGKFPKTHYEPSQVKAVLSDLWKAQQQDKNEH